MNNQIESKIEENSVNKSKYPYSNSELETVKLKYTLLDIEQIAAN